MGRLFTAADVEPGARPVVLVSEDFWIRRLNRDPATVGQPLVVDGTPRTIVGVLPAAVPALSDVRTSIGAAVFLPAPPPSTSDSRGDRNVFAVARLADGVTIDRARAALGTVSRDLAREYPDTNASVSAAVAPLQDDVARGARSSLLLVSGAVALIVLIGCVNIANLLVVRAAGEQRDVAIRLAIGATRRDVITGYLVRGVAFGVAGGAAGLLAGVWVRDALVAVAPASVIPRVGSIALHPRGLALSAAMAIVTGVLASVVPAFVVARRQAASALRSGGGHVGAARSVMRWRGLMLAGEVAMAVVLALGAGLMLRSVWLLDRVDLGFATERVATMVVRLPVTRYPDAAARLAFYRDLQQRLVPQPGVESVAFANQFPMRGGWGGGIYVEGRGGAIEGEADLQAVSPDYFETMGMRLRVGRVLADADRAGTLPVAVVSESFARQFLPGEDPIGRVVRRDASSPALTIVGVVADVRRDGKFAEVTPQVYLSALQPDFYSVSLSALAIRTAGDPLRIVPAVRQAVASLDPALVVSSVRTLDEILDASTASLRFHTWLLTSLGALALTLAVIGVYGVINYMALQRTREMGLRLALGATPGSVLRAVMAAGLRWAAAGLAIGLGAAYGVAQVLTSLLFGTTPHDAGTFGLVAVLVTTVAVAAAWLPARRVLAQDPLAALRSE
jgi:predicted permease